MKKYLIGGLLGFLALPISLVLAAVVINGPQALHTMYHMIAADPLPEALEAYQQPPYQTGTDYEIAGAFIDDRSFTYLGRNLYLFREEPVLQLTNREVTHICMSAFDADFFDVDITLSAEARQSLMANLLEKPTHSPDEYRFQFDDSKRYFLEGDGNRIAFFWVSPAGAKAYQTMIERNSQTPDIRLTVPMGQLYRFQFYLINGLADKPLEGCSPDINPADIPVWETMILPFWQD